MIPLFPSFKILELSDQPEVTEYVNKYPPYSDYNFLSLWSYGANFSISILNDNLVIKFTDYLGNEPFLSFLGTNKSLETVQELIEHAEMKKINPELGLIPEVSVASLTTKEYYIEEDVNNHDYIYDIREMINLSGDKLYSKKKHVNFFKSNYSHCRIEYLNLNDLNIQSEILGLIDLWAQNKKDENYQNERGAIERVITHAGYFNIICLGVYDKKNLIGFGIAEIIPGEFSMFHFVKADINYRGLFEILHVHMAEELEAKGSIYLNSQQDLGLPGLRFTKMKWRPKFFLKKYTIGKIPLT